VQHNSFGYLKRLSVWRCDNVVHVIPSHLHSCFHNLEELDVWGCINARVIFNINDENRFTKASGISRLKKLSLDALRNLEHVWDKDPEGIIGLKMLQEVRVSRCQCLESLFPASVAKDLTRLQVLEVIKCWKLAEIFKKVREGEGTTQESVESVFPCLTTLTLYQLPDLKYSIHCSKKEVILTTLPLRPFKI